MTTIEQWKEKGEFFLFKGQRVFYRDEGQGEPLVCIHGFPTSSWDWRLVWPLLTKKFRVIAIDMLGFGFSDKPPQYSYSVIDQADIHEALLAQLGITQYHLIAHDFGTLVSQELIGRSGKYRASQARAISLFAMSGSIFPELSKPKLIQKLLISRVAPIVTKLFNENKFNKSFSSAFAEKNKPEEKILAYYWRLLCENNGDKLLHHLNFFLKDRQQHGLRWAQAWQSADIPIRYLAGDEDPMYGKETIAKLKILSLKKDIIALPEAGHFPHIESPKEVVKNILEFMTLHL